MPKRGIAVTTTIRLTRPMQTKTSGLILPAGAIGHVLERRTVFSPIGPSRLTHAHTNLLVNFGLVNFVQVINSQADCFEYVEISGPEVALAA